MLVIAPVPATPEAAMITQNSHFDNVCIKSTGSYLPSRILTNDEIVRDLPTSSEWVVETLGICQRHIAEPEEYVSDLAARAGLDAIASAELEPRQIDLIIVATATPDRKAPSSACIAQAKMGICNCCAAFDVAAVCSGFVYGITIAGQFIQNGTYRHVLVIGADTFSKITDWKQRNCVFFGDGAGAVVLERKDRSNGLFSSILMAQGEGMNDFTVYPDDAYFTMNGKAVTKKATTALPECVHPDSFCEPTGNRRRFHHRSAPSLSLRSKTHRRGAPSPLCPNAVESGIVRQHRRSLSAAGAGSSKSTRLVAPITRTETSSVSDSPSISTRIWFSVWSYTRWLLWPPRLPPTTSSSSMKMMA
jgi:3-oxoacyl-[acyl-carrier-protein] synthase-3